MERNEAPGKTLVVTAGDRSLPLCSYPNYPRYTGGPPDSAGNVYLASGQIYVYDKQCKQIGILETSERPTSLAFGRTDKKTLFIAARSSLYAVRMSAAGK